MSQNARHNRVEGWLILRERMSRKEGVKFVHWRLRFENDKFENLSRIYLNYQFQTRQRRTISRRVIPRKARISAIKLFCQGTSIFEKTRVQRFTKYTCTEAILQRNVLQGLVSWKRRLKRKHFVQHFSLVFALRPQNWPNSRILDKFSNSISSETKLIFFNEQISLRLHFLFSFFFFF